MLLGASGRFLFRALGVSVDAARSPWLEGVMQYSLALRGKKPSVFDLLLNGRLHGILVDLRGVTDSRVITTDLLAADERAEIESLRPECKPFKYEQVTPTQLAAWPKD